MNIPNKLRINGIDVTVKVEDRNKNGVGNSGSAQCYT